MGTKATQILWIVIATLFVAAIIWFVTDSLAATAIAGTFTAVIGLFLGLDIAAMIHKTKGLDPGYYKEMNTHRYITALCVFALLLIEALILSVRFGREVNSLYLCFGVGFLTVIGGLISGVEANKIATDDGPEEE